MNIWLVLSILFEFLAFTISVIHYNKIKESSLRSLPFFLFFVFTGEISGIFIAKVFHNNIIFYNVFTTIQVVYYLFLVQSNIQSRSAKRGIVYTVVLFLLVALVNYFFIQDVYTELASFTFTMGCLAITIWVAYFFYELLQSDEIENYLNYPFFWIALGLFIFYVCNIQYMSVYNYLAVNYKKIFSAYFKIIELLDYMMYSFFIIGMLCVSRKK